VKATVDAARKIRAVVLDGSFSMGRASTAWVRSQDQWALEPRAMMMMSASGWPGHATTGMCGP